MATEEGKTDAGVLELEEIASDVKKRRRPNMKAVYI